jgi:type I restriction enzyme, S subunit
MIDGIHIPSHWVWAKFSDTARIASDLVDPTTTPNSYHIAPNHIQSWTGRLLPFGTVADDGVTSPKHRFHAGQILYSKIRPYLAKAAIAAFDGLCSADMYPVESQIETRYLLHWILSPWFTIQTSKNQGRTILPKINQVALGRLPVPVPPLREQRRIVSKIDELFSDLDAGVAALGRAKANLKRYRVAVLKAAVEGKLTGQWRAEHPPKESASQLLERILKERRRQWESDQLAAYEKAGRKPPANWKQKYKEPVGPDESNVLALPEGWCWASVQQIGSVQLGRQRSPKHHNGIYMRPYLRVANVFEDRIDTTDVMEMNFTPDEFETYRLSCGDILLNEGQSMELIGRPAMYRDEVPGACFTNTLVRFRPLNGVDAHFALKVFLAYLKNGRFQKIATITVNIAHLGAGRFSEIEFPLPPVEEQAAIIAEVNRHFSLIDAAERVINISLIRASRLRQSILKRAFQGKLVPQDPKDEPASVLMERIKAERTENESHHNGRTGARRSHQRAP